ncbi:MAG: amidophosphoribosyltransferase [Eubacteriales bacterium]|nr:amidophosphoribosyltransferase [Eubacteriales bacterium]
MEITTEILNDDTLHEECGVFGIFSPETANVASSVYYGLFALQHRGQEGCGITVNDDGVFHTHKDIGLLNDVFNADVLEKLGTGNMAIGHVRYGTTGGRSRENCQPMQVNHVKGVMSLVHNGNLTNAAELRRELELSGSIFHTTSDTEVIAYEITKERLRCPSIETAVEAAVNVIDGAFSLIILSPSKMIAVRDKRGFRPLCYGTREDGSYIVASESCALNAVGAHFVRDIEPGEILVIDSNGPRSIRTHCNTAAYSMCVFEYIYFARSDSIIDGVSVQDSRLKAGECLARSHPVEADVVVGVPDSGLDAALGFSRASGIPFGLGFIKNKYIGRTFIEPGQSVREDKVRIKLNPVESTVKNKRVVLVDDSIVRGTTSRRIISLLREAGAKEVHMRISSPPFTNPCYYGTDVDSREHLIACNHTTDEIAEIIGADSLGYLSIEDAKNIAKREGLSFCTACFSGDYPTEVPDPDNLAKTRFETKISENKKLFKN